MKNLLDLEGIITVLNTPFTENYEIDEISLKKNIKIAIDSGVKGFLVPAMASEVGILTRNQRYQLLKITLKESKNKVKIIGGIYEENDSERLKVTQDLIHMGCDGILLNIPFLDDESFYKKIMEVSDMHPNFIMIQDWSTSGYGIPLHLIVKMFDEIECFRSIKIEVPSAGPKYSDVLESCNNKLHVAGGWAVGQMIEGLDRGIHAFMPTGMHKIYTTIYNLHKIGKRDDAIKLFNQILPVLAFSNQHLDISIHFFKRLLHKQGVYSTPICNKNLVKFDKYHQRTADELIERVINITNNL